MTTAIAEQADLKSEVAPIVEWAKSLVIETPYAFEEAAEKLKQIKAVRKKIADTFTPIKRKQDEAKKVTLDEERKLDGPMQEAEGFTKRAMLSYQQAEQRKAQEEQARLQREADERTRKEREALERKAAAAKKPETQQKYAEQAAMVAPAPVIHVAAEVPKAAGISTRKVWKHRVIDPLKVPRSYLMVNDKALDGIAKSLKEMAQVDGVEFYTEEIMSAGSR